MPWVFPVIRMRHFWQCIRTYRISYRGGGGISIQVVRPLTGHRQEGEKDV
jgi:hypothetical protein